MFDTGLVSITFRSKSVDEVIRNAVACGLKYIEWGSDVHAPQNDPQRLRHIVQFLAVNSKAFRMYWQPNPDASVEDNLAHARAIKDYTVNIHAFHWMGPKAFSLEEGIGEWQSYLREFKGDYLLFLESMPDNSEGTLLHEANSLRKIIQGKL